MAEIPEIDTDSIVVLGDVARHIVAETMRVHGSGQTAYNHSVRIAIDVLASIVASGANAELDDMHTEAVIAAFRKSVKLMRQ